MTVVHETPGLIDIRSFTVLGVNAKPKSENPIGYFGTGLKYATAVLCRLGARVTVWIGREPYEFFTKPMKFRGSEFQQLYMRRQRGITRKWFSEELPFTTEFGKNWEVWMALRELHSNTLDEKGQSYEIGPDRRARTPAGGVLWPENEWPRDPRDPEWASEDTTRIVISLPAYAEAFARLSTVFLEGADERLASHGVQVLPGASTHIYYRGLRAKDLVKSAVRRWCFWGKLTLTEDRTVKEEEYAKSQLVTHVAASDDENLIRDVLTAAEDKWEHGIDFAAYMPYVVRSAAFTRLAQTHGKPALRHYVAFRAGPAALVTLPWQRELIQALEEEPHVAGDVAWRHKVRLRQLLEHSLAHDERVSEVHASPVPDPEPTVTDDDIPF